MVKTKVVEYILSPETVLKLSNISVLMRKRVKWIIEEKIITVSKYSKNALKLNGWVQLSKTELRLENEIKKGVSNYTAETKEDIYMLLEINNCLKCNLKLEENIGEIETDYIHSATITSTIFDRYKEIICKKIFRLKLSTISNTQIKAICSRIQSVVNLEIKNSTINYLDLRGIKVKHLILWRVKIEGNVHLPSNLAYLKVKDCSGLNFIQSNRITKLKFVSKDKMSKNDYIWLKTLVGLKKIKMSNCLRHCIDYLPHSVRKIEDNTKYQKLDTAKLKSCFPYLVSISAVIPLSVVQELNLRKIKNDLTDSYNLKITANPRKIAVKSTKMLIKYPELFEKALEIEILNEKIDLNMLPMPLKKLVVRDKQVKSNIISRFVGKSS